MKKIPSKKIYLKYIMASRNGCLAAVYGWRKKGTNIRAIYCNSPSPYVTTSKKIIANKKVYLQIVSI